MTPDDSQNAGPPDMSPSVPLPPDADEVPVSELDAGIARGAATPGAPLDPPLDRIQSGAAVYTADGANVAVVEGISHNFLTLRAGQPGRPIDIPPDEIASVSPDGQRVDLRLSGQQIERFAGPDQPGYARLLGQSGQIESDLRREHQEQATAPRDASMASGDEPQRDSTDPRPS